MPQPKIIETAIYGNVRFNFVPFDERCLLNFEELLSEELGDIPCDIKKHD